MESLAPERDLRGFFAEMDSFFEWYMIYLNIDEQFRR